MFTYYKFEYSILMFSVLLKINSYGPHLTLGMMINLIDRF